MMRRYNKQDIVLLEGVYEKIKGWYKSHPSMTAYDDAPGCPTCRSTDVQRRGFNVAKVRKTQRMHCRNCGAWYPGEIIKKGAA
jgi:transcription elongation factor Elf1